MDNFNFDEFLLPYELSVQGFQLKLEGIKRQYQLKDLHSPIETVMGRVKSPASIKEKLGRLGLGLEGIETLYDIAGIRIICKYIEDIFDVSQMIRNRRDIEVIKEKDYVSNIKPSGYRSFHIMGRYYVETVDGVLPINIEFQIRTNAMHLWATVEHRLRYKYNKAIPPQIQERLVRASSACSAIDEEMSAIKLEIEDAQRQFAREKPRQGETIGKTGLPKYW